MKLLNYNIHKEIQIDNPQIIKINDSSMIEIGQYRKLNDIYYTVVLKLKNKEIFLGKFSKDYSGFKVQYNNGKILIYTDIFDRESYSFKINRVLSLYEILDDLFYSCTEFEALEIFDPTIDKSFLENKDRSIFRNDSEKKRRNKLSLN